MLASVLSHALHSPDKLLSRASLDHCCGCRWFTNTCGTSAAVATEFRQPGCWRHQIQSTEMRTSALSDRFQYVQVAYNYLWDASGRSSLGVGDMKLLVACTKPRGETARKPLQRQASTQPTHCTMLIVHVARARHDAAGCVHQAARRDSAWKALQRQASTLGWETHTPLVHMLQIEILVDRGVCVVKSGEAHAPADVRTATEANDTSTRTEKKGLW